MMKCLHFSRSSVAAMHICAYVYRYVYTYIYICIYIQVEVCIYIYMCVCVCDICGGVSILYLAAPAGLTRARASVNEANESCSECTAQKYILHGI